MVGVAFVPNVTNVEAFLWQQDVVRGLGTLPGDASSSGNAINDEGQVVGQSCDANGNCRGFLWQDGVMMDLNALVSPDSTLNLLDPSDINSRGEIVGLGVQKSTGELRAFLLTPSKGEVAGESAAAAAQGNISERRTVVLPENVRRVLRQRLGSRYRIAKDGSAAVNVT